MNFIYQKFHSIANLPPILGYRWRRHSKSSDRKIFIDCGANTGKVFQQFYKQIKDFEFYLFEPQPELSDKLENLVQQINNPKVKFFSQAVWIKDEQREFFLATRWGDNFKGGSSIVKAIVNNRSKIAYDQPIDIQAIDFDKWILEYLSPSVDDYLILKMDIEGAEYEVLEKMIVSGSICFFNELIVEFHERRNEAITKERHNNLIKRLKKLKQLNLAIWH